MRLRWLGACLTVGACKPDYELVADLPPFGEPNPPELTVPPQTDRFVQPNPTVDVLFVLDNSTSMADERDALASSFPLFVQKFVEAATDWHLGVISTDLLDASTAGRLVEIDGHRWIDATTVDPIGTFSRMTAALEDGSGVEMGLGTVYTAIEIEGALFNAGFLRDDAPLHTVVVGDENDVTPLNLLSLEQFVVWYSALRGRTSDRTFSSVVTLKGVDAGVAYTTASALIGGVVWDIEDTNWPLLADSFVLQGSLLSEFFLSRPPVLESIEVLVRTPDGVTIRFGEAEFDGSGALVAGEWVYSRSRNSITFAQYVPEPQTVVEITYIPARTRR